MYSFADIGGKLSNCKLKKERLSREDKKKLRFKIPTGKKDNKSICIEQVCMVVKTI